MSYIAFDLDALNAAPAVARAAGVGEELIIAGLVRLWAWCFREKTDRVTSLQVRGHFSADVCDALAAFGFLEGEGSTWRVKGAGRYLRVSEARAKAGRARASGAGRSAGQFTSTSPAATSTAPAPDQHTTSSTPSTEHRTPSTKETTTDLSNAPRSTARVTPEALVDKLTESEFQVFEHWRTILKHPEARATPKRKAKLSAALKLYTVEELQRAIDGCAASAWHMGANDRGKRFDSLELILRDAEHIERFMGETRGAA